ncbi:MAG: OmpA family protein [Smithella sp.]|jgi:outer membrane protein OmpA-like peptidoglycan-associated protein
MFSIKLTVIKRGFGLLVLLIILAAGCGPTQKEMMARDHLDRARTVYAQVAADQNMATYAQGTLMEADNAIKAGEQASDYKEVDHQAYLAERKTQVAKTVTEGKMAEKERDASSREKDQLVFQTKRQVDAKSRELQESKMELAAGAVVLSQVEKEKMDAEVQARKAEKEKAENELFIRELSRLAARQTDRGVTVTLGDVLFATGRSTLSLQADDNIDKLVEFMSKYSYVNVLVEGYTDSVGKEDMNLALSLKRADAIKEKLVDKEINPQRITTKGYGEQYATADNNTIDGRKQNRRVEILLLGEGVNPEDRFRK